MPASEPVDFSKIPPNPLDVVCPGCNAQPNRPCTAPTDTGRRVVHWTHQSREKAAYNAAQEEGQDATP